MLDFADTDGVCGFAASLVRGRHQSLVWHGQASRGDTHWEMAYYQYHGVTVHKLMLGARKQFQNFSEKLTKLQACACICYSLLHTG